jgi:hypothetical protein
MDRPGSEAERSAFSDRTTPSSNYQPNSSFPTAPERPPVREASFLSAGKSGIPRNAAAQGHRPSERVAEIVWNLPAASSAASGNDDRTSHASRDEWNLRGERHANNVSLHVNHEFDEGYGMANCDALEQAGCVEDGKTQQQQEQYPNHVAMVRKCSVIFTNYRPHEARSACPPLRCLSHSSLTSSCQLAVQE